MPCRSLRSTAELPTIIGSLMNVHKLPASPARREARPRTRLRSARVSRFQTEVLDSSPTRGERGKLRFRIGPSRGFLCLKSRNPRRAGARPTKRFAGNDLANVVQVISPAVGTLYASSATRPGKASSYSTRFSERDSQSARASSSESGSRLFLCPLHCVRSTRK